MSKSKKTKSGVPTTKIYAGKEAVKLSEIASRLIYSIELLKHTRNKLRRNKRLTERLDLEFKITMGTIANILDTHFAMTKAFIVAVEENIHNNEEEFQRNLTRFMDIHYPNAGVLVTTNLEKEMQDLSKRNILAGK